MSTFSAQELLRARPSLQSKSAIIASFFTHGQAVANVARFSQYFTYYELELVVYHTAGFKQPTVNTRVTTHGDLLVMLETIKEYPQLTRAELRNKLREVFDGADDLELDRSAELAVRTGLMLNVREPQQILNTRNTSTIAWQDSVRLKDIIDLSFPLSRWKLNAKESRIHPLFTAAFMVNICGLQLQWTYCLADHLSLGRDRKHPSRRVLRVFPYKHCLQTLVETTDWSGPSRTQEGELIDVRIPRQVLTETIQSLNLLFPHWDPASNKLLRDHDQSFHQIAPFEGPGSLNLMEFDHWRDRLLEVYDVVFTSPPASWKQLMLDRRSPQQFWTFWIALLILALTLVQTGTGIKQAIGI